MLSDCLGQAARLISAGRVHTPKHPDRIIIAPGFKFRSSTWGLIMMCSQKDQIFFEEGSEPNVLRFIPTFANPSEKGLRIISEDQYLPPWLVGNLESVLYQFNDPATPGTITQLRILSIQTNASKTYEHHAFLHFHSAR